MKFLQQSFSCKLFRLISTMILFGALGCQFGTECRSDTDCSGKQVCGFGYCKEKSGCLHQKDCPKEQECKDSRCLIKVECKKKSDCNASKLCEKNKCVNDPAFCENDKACGKKEHCLSNKCVLKTGCKSKTDCLGGEVCLSGKCKVKPSCKKNSDCSNREVCLEGKCVENIGAIVVGVSINFLLVEEVSKVTVSLSSKSMSAQDFSLTKKNGQWTVLIPKVLGGAGYSLDLKIFDKENKVLGQEKVGAFSVEAMKTTGVLAFSPSRSRFSNNRNNPPIIAYAFISNMNPKPNEKIFLTIHGTDADTDQLTYQWSAGTAHFRDASSALTELTIPSKGDELRIRGKITDGKGGESTLLIRVFVREHPVFPAKSIFFNAFPMITAIGGSPSPAKVDREVSVWVEVNDQDGDVISFRWSENCGGKFDFTEDSSAAFTVPSSVPKKGSCRLLCTVSDTRKGVSVKGIEIPISN